MNLPAVLTVKETAAELLTDRQIEILLAYARSGSYKVAARQLGIAPSTVRATLVNVRERLGVTRSIQAVLKVFGQVA